MGNEIEIFLSLNSANALQKLNSFLEEAGEGLKAFAMETLAAYTSMEGLRQLDDATKEVINLEESIGRLSQKTGLTVAVLAAMREEASKIGMPFEELNTSLGKFAQNIFAGASEGGKLAEPFQLMGVSLVDLQGHIRSTDAVLEDTSRWFQLHADGAEKARVATELFGKSGRELIPILDEGAEGIERMKSEGGPINDASVTNATSFNETLRQMNESLEMVFTSLVNHVLPCMVTFVETLKSLEEIINTVRPDFDLFNVVVAYFAGGFLEAATAISIAIDGCLRFGNVLNTFVTETIIAVKEQFKNLATILKDSITLWEDLATAAIASGEAMADAAHGHFSDAKAIIKENLLSIGTDTLAIYDDIVKAADTAISGIKKVTDKAGNEMFNFTTDAVQMILKMNEAIAKMNSGHAGDPAKHFGGAAQGDTMEPKPETLKQMNQWLQIANEQYQLQVKMIQSNPYESEVQKAAELIPVLQQRRAEIEQEMDTLVKNAQVSAKTDEDRINTTKELYKLQGELNDVKEKETTARNTSSLGGQIGLQFSQLLAQTDKFAKDAGTLLMSPITGFQTGFSNALNQMMETGKFNFATLGLAIGKSMREAFVTMVSDFVVHNILMAGISKLFHAADLTTHVATEKAKTLATALGESESADTTVGYGLVRLGVHAKEAGAGAAAAESSIPYVGPILAVAAMAAMVASVMAMGSGMGREAGGPVTAGMPYIVGERRPELFVPSQSGFIVPHVPAPSTQLAQSGGSSGSGGGANVQIMSHFHDDYDAMDKVIKNNPKFHHLVTDIVRKNAYLIPSKG